jgi:hypothetical protein
MKRDIGQVVGPQIVVQTLPDPAPGLIAVSPGIVLEPHGEGVTRGLQDLMAAYAGGFLNYGGYRHGQQYDLVTA